MSRPITVWVERCDWLSRLVNHIYPLSSQWLLRSDALRWVQHYLNGHSYTKPFVGHTNLCADWINYIYSLCLSTMAINCIREHSKTVPINFVISYWSQYLCFQVISWIKWLILRPYETRIVFSYVLCIFIL